MAMQTVFCTFETPSSYTANESLTPLYSAGIDSVEVTANLTDGLVATVTFNSDFDSTNNGDGYFASGQMQGEPGGVWNHKAYETYYTNIGGQMKKKLAGSCDIWLPKYNDLATTRIISLFAHGEEA